MQFIIYFAIFLITAVIFTFVGFIMRKKIAESKLKSAENEANQIKEDLEKNCNFKEIQIMPMRGLCSYYALEKGLIICH